MRSGTAGVIARGVVLVAVCGAAWVSAQPPASAPIYDPNVEQIQRLQPPVPPPSLPDSPRNPSGTNALPGVTTTPSRGQSPVVDPLPPVLQLQVRTPAHVPIGKPVPYKVIVTNTSPSKALRVKVRMPWPDGAAALTKCEPKFEGLKEMPPLGIAPLKELVWEVGDLQRGEPKTFEMMFTPTPDAKKVAGTAYVSFEYGAKVETAIDKPKINVKRMATPEVAVNGLITVSVDVTNPGTVAVPKVRLLEQAPPDTEFRRDDDAEKTNIEGQRAWDLGTIAPGQTKNVTYQLLARKSTVGNGMLTSSAVSSGDVTLDVAQAESRTKVLHPALKLEFTGSPTTTPKSPAVYKAVVRNVGTLPLANVTLTMDVPEGLSVTKRRHGAKVEAGRSTWTLPKLAAGEAEEFNITCEPEQGVAGKKLLKATARDGRGLVDVQTAEVGTEFVGKADLTWKPQFEKAWVQVGRQGTLKVTVKNQGAETDNGVRLRVKLPPEVKYIGNNGSIPATFENAEVLFPAQKLAPGKDTEFVVTYEGKTAGSGRFMLILEGESLGKQPLTKEQEILIER